MAKKSAARRKPAAEGTFDDKKFPGARIQATFDYNELSLIRAANQLGQRGKNVALAVAFVSLATVILVLLFDQSNLAPALVILAISVVSSSVATRWDKVQLRYARKTSLGFEGSGDRRRVTLTDDALHLETSNGTEASYPLSELRFVHATDDSVTAGFAKGCYVYVPRSALSENRFKELVRILKQHTA